MLTEKHVEIAAKMYDARHSLQSLYPDIFADRCKEWQKAVRKVMAVNGLSELEAMIDMLKELKSEGMAQLWVLASVVEMLEPSEGL